MMNKKSNKPYLRFPGFTDAWEKRKLGDMFNYERPDRYIVASDHYSSEGTPVLTANKSFILGYTNEKGTYDKGDSIIFDDFTLDSKFVDFPYKVKSSAIKILTAVPGINLRFSYELLKYVHIDQEGHARHYLSIVRPKQELIPSEEEQIKISIFFQKLDSFIAANQREYKKLTDLKNAYLHKMFPSDGKDVPELRFPGFTDAWEKRKLGEMTKLVSGYSFKSSNFGIGSFPVIRITNILEDGSVGGNFVTYEKKELDDKYVAKSGQLVIAMSGATTGKIGQVSATALVNQRVGLFAELTINVHFLKVILARSSFKEYIENLWGAGAQPNVSVKQINSYEISIPSTNIEQQQIGIFFQKLDSLIAANQREGKKLEELKQSLLKEMFV